MCYNTDMVMSSTDKTLYWLELAEYDLDCARVMLDGHKFLYVGFLCHQVVEKLLKSYYWKTINSEPPYTHNLLVLCEKSKLIHRVNESEIRLINVLMPLNIQARYPENREVLMKSLDFTRCSEIMRQTGEFYIWIKPLLNE